MLRSWVSSSAHYFVRCFDEDEDEVVVAGRRAPLMGPLGAGQVTFPLADAFACAHTDSGSPKKAMAGIGSWEAKWTEESNFTTNYLPVYKSEMRGHIRLCRNQRMSTCGISTTRMVLDSVAQSSSYGVQNEGPYEW